LDLLFAEGISKELDLLDAALELNVVTQAGAWFAFKGANIAQGREQALKLLKDNATMALDIETNIFAKIKERRAVVAL